MLFPLWSSSIYLKDICSSTSLFLDLFAQEPLWGVGITRVICAVRNDVDVVLLSVLLCMHHWLVGFSTLLE
jgi:hypothetical protein